MSTWSTVLDDMEGRIAEVDRLLATGGAPLPEFRLPDDLGPLPADLVGRAERVYALTVDAELRVEAAQAAILAAVRGPGEPRPEAAYVDRLV